MPTPMGIARTRTWCPPSGPILTIADGWIHLVNLCDKHRDSTVILNAAARNNETVSRHPETPPRQHSKRSVLSSMRGGSSTGSATARSVADDIYTKRLALCGIHGAADYS